MVVFPSVPLPHCCIGSSGRVFSSLVPRCGRDYGGGSGLHSFRSCGVEHLRVGLGFHAPIHPVLRCFYVLLEGGDSIIWALFGGRLMLRLWRRERGGGKRGQGGGFFTSFGK